jgi:SulP family sulfate permease
MAQAVKVETGLPGAGLPGAGIPLAGMPVAERDVPDQTAGQPRTTYDVALATDPDVVVYRISGAFFFGAAASVGAALDRIGEHPKAYVIDFSAVPVIDSTAAATIEGFARKAHRQGAELHIAGALPAVRRRLLTHGVRPPGVHFHATLHEAVAAAHHRKDSIGATPARAAAGPPLTGP